MVIRISIACSSYLVWLFFRGFHPYMFFLFLVTCFFCFSGGGGGGGERRVWTVLVMVSFDVVL